MFFGFSLEVLYACPDSAPEIQNALVDCFGPQSKCDGSVNPQPTLETRFMNFVATCYYHVKSAIETNKHRFSSEQSRTLFEGDMYIKNTGICAYCEFSRVLATDLQPV